MSFKAAVEGDTEEAPQPQFDCEVGTVSPRPCLSGFLKSYLIKCCPQPVYLYDVETGGQGAEKVSQRSGGRHPP